MIRKTKAVGRTATRIRDLSRKAPRLAPAMVARRLGAEPLGIRVPRTTDAIGLLAVGSALLRRLRSQGGRPSLNGTTRRQKIPLSPEDVRALEEIAHSIATLHGVKVSLGQVASVILNLNIAGLLRDTRGLKELDAPQLRHIAARVVAKRS